MGRAQYRKQLTSRWCSGQMSNFEYLMSLNTLAGARAHLIRCFKLTGSVPGRTFNDLTQYPVFPFILKDYTSASLDLSNPAVYRDLTKPMGAQDEARLAKFLEKYNYLIDAEEEIPYHYGSHYSNVGSVLHFLVRIEPFTQFFLEFQGGRFDIPDRTFHSIQQTWYLSSAGSSTDVKELIPEFFYFPEFLVNINNFDFGVRQDDSRVGDVALPPWAKNNTRLFIQRNRQALESQHVSERLHHWIDLIFGYKQTGEEAARANNLFHPLTYEGYDVTAAAEDDDLKKQAMLAQISSYGQTPTQLFSKPVRGLYGLNFVLTLAVTSTRSGATPRPRCCARLWATRRPTCRCCGSATPADRAHTCTFKSRRRRSTFTVRASLHAALC